jgi:hypothetical protein
MWRVGRGRHMKELWLMALVLAALMIAAGVLTGKLRPSSYSVVVPVIEEGKRSLPGAKVTPEHDYGCSQEYDEDDIEGLMLCRERRADFWKDELSQENVKAYFRTDDGRDPFMRMK